MRDMLTVVMFRTFVRSFFDLLNLLIHCQVIDNEIVCAREIAYARGIRDMAQSHLLPAIDIPDPAEAPTRVVFSLLLGHCRFRRPPFVVSVFGASSSAVIGRLCRVPRRCSDEAIGV